MKKPLIAAAVVIALLAAVLLLFLQINEASRNRPPEPLTTTVSVTAPPSTFNLPVHIETKTLAAYLNGKIRGTFLRKNLRLRKGEKEKIALALTRQSDIVINSGGRELVCTFPLTVDATLLDSRFGKTLSGLVKPLHTTIIVTLSTPIALDRNWSIVTRFRIRNIRWLSEPVVRIGPFKKNIRQAITEALNSKGGKLTAMLDREVYRAANLHSTISDVWLDLQDPILVSSKPAPVWIRFHCSGIRGYIALNRNDITCITRIDARMVMLTDTTAMTAPNPLPPFSRLVANRNERHSVINLYAFTSFEEINDQLNGYLRGKTLSRKGYNVTITGIETYASGKGLSIGVSTDRDIRGYLVTSGKIVFDAPTQTLKVKKFDYALDTGNAIFRTGDDLLHEFVRDTVATKLNVKLDTLIGKVPGIISNAIAKGKTGKVIDLKIDSLRVERCDIILDSKKVHLLLKVDAMADLRLKGIKPGKAVRVY